MSGMEPEIREFLKRILLSVCLGLLWLFANMTIGIYLGWLFVRDGMGVGNVLYYCFFLATLVLLIRYYRHSWRKKFPHG